ncbi:MAG: hypothetical protein WBS24_01665 [Terriglobales bacterium]
MLLAMGAVALGQKDSGPAKPPKAKPSNEFKVNNESNPRPNASIGATPGNASSKNLQRIEREQPKSGKPSSKKTTAAISQDKQKPAPKINFKPASAQKTGGSNRPAPDPLKGRLKQKGQH